MYDDKQYKPIELKTFLYMAYSKQKFRVDIKNQKIKNQETNQG